MKILAMAIIGLVATNFIQLRIAKKQEKRIDELEEKQRIQEAFDESEAE
jgi:hypothetical protein